MDGCVMEVGNVVADLSTAHPVMLHPVLV